MLLWQLHHKTADFSEVNEGTEKIVALLLKSITGGMSYEIYRSGCGERCDGHDHKR